MAEVTPSDSLRDEFNRWADAGRGEAMEQEHLPIVLPVLDRMRLAPDDNVLDVGCGAGWLVAMLAEQVPEGRVVGLDISGEMIRHARQRNDEIENVVFIVGEASEIPWESHFFTRVISVESAYYWPDPARGVREMIRVLREGGSAWVLVNYYLENPHAHHWSEMLSVPVHLLSAEEWSALFRSEGFANVAWERIPDPTPAPDAYAGGWFRSAAELRAFRETGALLVRGIKPKA